MASFIYFYSKFTEEFLLLSAAAMFALLSVYCYHWVIKKRRLGAARNQVPAGMVKAYLNQLIQEAQFVRTQLFGLIANGETPENMAAFQSLLLKGQAPSSDFSSASFSTDSSAGTASSGAAIPSDLLERLKALEAQLSEKESMVVNINVEKTKLLEEIDQMKQNEQAMQNAASSSNTDDLVKKIKSLEERLEEYSLFEDDLANLKRLQQENTQLKKRLEESGVAATSVVADEEPVVEPGVHAPESSEPSEPSIQAQSDEPILKESGPFALDQNAIDSLLDGVTPTSPEKQEAKPEAQAEEPQPEAPAETQAAAPATEPEAPSDEFEKLVDSVENSLESVVAAPATENPTAESPAQKTDEELLKEFENLLNS